ncbi:MAG: polysaccharide biosynthesis protein [Alphaproteobacteria bacterium]|nr:SDR family NAD(P)-dependent oxidoreductase [Pseudomonadota bacterium]
MDHSFSDKRVLITGACGTVGRELVHQLLTRDRVSELIAVDINDGALVHLEEAYRGFSNVTFSLMDVRNRKEVQRRMNGVDIAFHAAALKHVLLCERAPSEAIQTNIHGVQNMIEAALDADIEYLIFTSTDKAVNPTSVMGSTKLTAERLMTAGAENGSRTEGPVLISTRFGNILGSRGSVIPIFREQIRRGGPITLTDPAMTRFIMALEDAVRLVIESVQYARTGDVLVTKMPVIRIADLAEVMREELAPSYGHAPDDIEIVTIGPKPGEKMFEELMSSEETRRALQLERYFVIRPALGEAKEPAASLYAELVTTELDQAYTSKAQTALTKEELRTFLRDHELLESAEEDPPMAAPLRGKAAVSG